jgi:S1-C subfamily serine protease
VVERRPESFGGPCPWIDANVAVAAPSAPEAFVFGFATQSPPDAPRVVQTPTPTASGVIVAPEAPRVYAGPMVAAFANGSAGVAGAQLSVVDRDLGSYFGVDRGLLVLSVLQGTVALRAGLKAGDVLLTADGVELASAATLRRVMTGAKDRSVTLVIMRDHKRRNVELKW